MAELPSGTVTFLFTDLEGSTRLWEEQPAAMSEALARHDEFLRGAVDAHDGVVLSRMGDGIAAVFTSAPHAVEAAVEVQQLMAAEPWADTGPLRARMALHTDEGRMRAPGEYMNQPLNRCARLMATAHGGQVLLSDATAAVTRGRLPEGADLVDLGEHRLRDLAAPMHVFQVVHPGLPPEFPPIRSLDVLPGNLPAQLTSFVGRADELAGVAEALDAWRLVTLTGTGGVGKTRLAVQVAAEVLPRFRDGAWLCELAVALDDETMAQVVAAVLGVSQRAGMSLAASVTDYLRAKTLLLILDNCEQLLAPVSALAESVLRDCPGVRILATSREGLAAGGERVWPLRSLPVPDASDPVISVTTNDAAMLFSDRAQAARASFVLDSSNARAVADICRRLDGIPLAIELAAARVVSLSPLEISALLDERFRLLTGGRRSAVERHQTLRATVDWSYSLLGERERVVFDRLGVFAGSFEARAARTIVACTNVDEWDVLDALGELVAKSMVVAEETADGTSRYQMFETLGQYARERLDEDGDVDEWRRRHAMYFAVWAEEAGPGLVGPDELAWRTQENAELDNLRAAVTWALDRSQPEDIGLALRIVGSLAAESQTNTTAGVGAWAERALPYVEFASPQLRYAVTAAAAWYQFDGGHFEQAQVLALRALETGVPVGSPAPDKAHLALGVSTLMLGDGLESLAIELESARLLDVEFPGTAAAAHAHAVAALAAQIAGDPVARNEAETALRQARESANPTALVIANLALGQALSTDDPANALAAFEEALSWSSRGGGPVLHGTVLCFAATVRARMRDFANAARDLAQGIERTHQDGSRTLFYVGSWSGIEILVGLDRHAEAAVFDGITSAALAMDYRDALGFAPIREAIARARAALGPERYDELLATGAAMTYDQAVEHALRVLDAVIDETNQTRNA